MIVALPFDKMLFSLTKNPKFQFCQIFDPGISPKYLLKEI